MFEIALSKQGKSDAGVSDFPNSCVLWSHLFGSGMDEALENRTDSALALWTWGVCMEEEKVQDLQLQTGLLERHGVSWGLSASRTPPYLLPVALFRAPPSSSVLEY